MKLLILSLASIAEVMNKLKSAFIAGMHNATSAFSQFEEIINKIYNTDDQGILLI